MSVTVSTGSTTATLSRLCLRILAIYLLILWSDFFFCTPSTTFESFACPFFCITQTCTHMYTFYICVSPRSLSALWDPLKWNRHFTLLSLAHKIATAILQALNYKSINDWKKITLEFQKQDHHEELWRCYGTWKATITTDNKLKAEMILRIYKMKQKRKKIQGKNLFVWRNPDVFKWKSFEGQNRCQGQEAFSVFISHSFAPCIIILCHRLLQTRSPKGPAATIKRHFFLLWSPVAYITL